MKELKQSTKFFLGKHLFSFFFEGSFNFHRLTLNSCMQFYKRKDLTWLINKKLTAGKNNKNDLHPGNADNF